MATLLYVIGALFVLSLVITASAVLLARDGIEDADGFHALDDIDRRESKRVRSTIISGRAEIPPLSPTR